MSSELVREAASSPALGGEPMSSELLREMFKPLAAAAATSKPAL